MHTESAQVSSKVRDLIERACARNAPAELRFEGDSHDAGAAHIRLIRIEGDEIYADAPLIADAGTAPGKGRGVMVHTVIDGARYAFHTHLVRVFTTVALNTHKRIAAVSLALPTRIALHQRRDHYRVSVVGNADIQVAFCETLPDQPDCCALDAERFSGRMVNLSASGLCAIVPISRRPRFHRDERFFADFALPGADPRFRLSVQVRHFRRTREGADTLVGLRFKTDLAWPTGTLIQSITRFVATEERRQLRRGRKP